MRVPSRVVTRGPSHCCSVLRNRVVAVLSRGFSERPADHVVTDDDDLCLLGSVLVLDDQVQ